MFWVDDQQMSEDMIVSFVWAYSSSFLNCPWKITWTLLIIINLSILIQLPADVLSPFSPASILENSQIFLNSLNHQMERLLKISRTHGRKRGAEFRGWGNIWILERLECDDEMKLLLLKSTISSHLQVKKISTVLKWNKWNEWEGLRHAKFTNKL